MTISNRHSKDNQTGEMREVNFARNRRTTECPHAGIINIIRKHNSDKAFAFTLLVQCVFMDLYSFIDFEDGVLGKIHVYTDQSDPRNEVSYAAMYSRSVVNINIVY